jgi:hypothetical protein
MCIVEHAGESVIFYFSRSYLPHLGTADDDFASLLQL